MCEHPLQLDVCKAFLGLPRDAVHPFSVAAVAYEGWMRSMLWPQAANHGQVFSLRVSVDWNKKVALAYKLKRAYHRSPFPCELALRYIYILGCLPVLPKRFRQGKGSLLLAISFRMSSQHVHLHAPLGAKLGIVVLSR